MSAPADPVPWLLEGDDPSVRFFTLTELLGSSADSPEAAAARREIMTGGAVPRILAAQGDDGHWEGRDRFYTAKYRGTVWSLIILAELGTDGGDQRMRRGCEAILRDAQERESGGFASHACREGGGRRSEVIPCLTGNMVWSLIRLGMFDDPRVQAGVDWLTTYMRCDDGDGEAPTGWPYDRWEMCWGRHTCHMGVVKALKALAEIPPERRSPAVRRTLDEGIEFMLRHHVHKRSHEPAKTSKPGWRRLSFPLMYQTDVLEILGILTKLGRGGGERAREARALVASR
ncbi:MAG TPA: nitrogen fixation protein NifH, partial [Thermoleophilia bacterium]|nr:nitrogen fixation protein NifH [Thermoleophilia bacterium]